MQTLSGMPLMCTHRAHVPHLFQVTYPLHIILRYELEKASGVRQAAYLGMGALLCHALGMPLEHAVWQSWPAPFDRLLALSTMRRLATPLLPRRRRWQHPGGRPSVPAECNRSLSPCFPPAGAGGGQHPSGRPAAAVE